MANIILRCTTVKADGSTVYREEPVHLPYVTGSGVADTLEGVGEMVKRWNRQNFMAGRVDAAPLHVYSVWVR